MSVIEPIPAPLETATTAARAIRKATLRLIPLIAIAYGVAYIDRVNISFAALQMNRDLHFTPAIYGFGAGLFFLSYAACEIPSNLLLYRFGARRWLARIMFTWGLLAMGMMFVRTPWQFYTMRFLLGMAEAGFFPGILFYFTLWFPGHIRARAISRFYIAMPISFVVMGIIAGALLNLQGKLNLAGWQWLFLVEGLPAILLSFVFLAYLPDRPADATWLTPAEKYALVSLLDQPEAPGTHTGDMGHALLDPRLWQVSLLCLFTLTCNYAYAFSAPTIIASITTLNSLRIGYVFSLMNLLGAPAMLLNAIHSDRTRERRWHIAIPFLLMAVAFVISGISRSPTVIIVALAVSAVSFFAMQGPLLSQPAAFLKGKSAAAGLATMNMIGILGGFLGPWWMGLAKTYTGSYQHGLLTLALPSLAGAALILASRQPAQQSN